MSKRAPDESLPDMDLAALYALGALAPEERATFESQLAADAALRTEVEGLRAVAGELALSVKPLAPRAEIRARLLERVAAERVPPRSDAGEFFFAREREIEWKEFGPGVASKLLTPGVGLGGRVFVLRIAPGGTVAAHDHRVTEHCYVLGGDVRVLGQTLGPGDYHRAAAGTRHLEFTSESGCLLLIVDGPASA